MTGKPRASAEVSPFSRVVSWFGGTRAGVWTIKHLVSPLDRRLYRATGGRLLSTGRPRGPIALLTTTGRRTGSERTTPVFHLRDGERVVLCNVRPASEHANPWTLNLRAHPMARVQIGSQTRTYRAREATPAELAGYWPQLVSVWPAYERFYHQGGQRSVFVLEPTTAVGSLGPR
jgi:deazaflavin-dependent oxidoreductase (nitroreductase family)